MTASARHQSDTAVKHGASLLPSGNRFFCKSQRLECERGRRGLGPGMTAGSNGMSWDRGCQEKMEVKQTFSSGFRNPARLPSEGDATATNEASLLESHKWD